MRLADNRGGLVGLAGAAMSIEKARLGGVPAQAPCGGLKAAYTEHRAGLARFLAARRVPAEEAEDLLQDLYVKLDGLHTGPIAEPRAYLFRMLDNLLLDQRRSAARRKGREELWMSTQDGTESGRDESPSAEAILMARQKLDMVLAALNELPQRTVEIFRYYRIDDWPQKRIAGHFGISVSAVEKHLQRAYRAVAEIQQQVDEDRPSQQRLCNEGDNGPA
jgi:RNA polymerase sigma-70 factor (ECF subfamily)